MVARCCLSDATGIIAARRPSLTRKLNQIPSLSVRKLVPLESYPRASYSTRPVRPKIAAGAACLNFPLLPSFLFNLFACAFPRRVRPGL
jgi:hypothetical protein